VLLAVGGGVLIAGIKAAADNPKVAAAFDGLKKKASKVFENFGKPFEQPLIRAAGTFGKTLDNLKPHIQKLADTMAPVIDKLAPALAGFFEAVMPGIQKAVEASLPMFETLAEHLPKIGDAIGDFFTSIAESGPAAAQFFGDLLTAVEWVIRSFGTLIGAVAKWYSTHRAALVAAKNRFVEFKDKAIEAGRKVIDWFKELGGKVAAALDGVGDKIVAPFKWAFDKIMGLWNSTIGSLSLPSWVPGVGGGSTPGRASGGPVSAGRSYLVGERGPEVLTMGGNGWVTPNRELGGGGDVVEVHVHLADEVTKVIRLHDRDLKRRVRGRRAGVA